MEDKNNLYNQILKPIEKYWQYHYLFLVIGLFFGLKMVFLNPPWHTNDEDRHFYNAYALAQGNFAPEVKDKQIGHYVPTNLVASVTIHQGVGYQNGQLMDRENLKKLETQLLQPEKQEFCPNVSSYIFPLPYVPAAIMIKFGMLIRDNPVWIGWWGRIGSLLAYLLIIFFAIKIIPHFKGLLMAVALSPMALFQGASVTYDTLNLAFIFLLFAFIIKFYFQPEPLRLKHILIYVLIAFLHRCTKDGYFILYFAILCLGFQKFASKQLVFYTIVLLVAVTYLPDFFWMKYISSLHLPGAPMQNDFLFNGSLNLRYYLQDPVNLILIVIKNTFAQGKIWFAGIVGRFGYSYTVLPQWLVFIHVLVYALAVIYEKPIDIICSKFKYKLLVVSLLNFIAIIFGILIYVSPVGADLIYGLQGRYFLPIIPFLFLSLFYIPINKNEEKSIKFLLPVYLIFVLTYTIFFIDTTFYIL